MHPWPRSGGAGARDAAPPRAPSNRCRAGCRWAAGRDPLERPARAGRGLQRLAGRRIVVARADRARLLQGRRGTLAGPRLPRPRRRDVAPRAALRLARFEPLDPEPTTSISRSFRTRKTCSRAISFRLTSNDREIVLLGDDQG